jgi:dihydroflavonol-4-reductase
MKTLVTGSTGFIGSHLAERLAAMGHHVRCVVRSPQSSFPRGMVREGLEVWPVDFEDRRSLAESLEGIQCIYHLAGTTRARNTRDYYEGNFLLTKRLAEACLEANVTIDRFIHVSSLSAVGPSGPGEEPDESAACHPVSHYGKSKLLGEEVLRRADGRIPLVIVRPAAVYGPRDRDLLRYFQMVRKGLYPRIGASRKYLNLVYCDDIVDGIILAGESAQSVGRTYFLAAPCSYDTDEIAESIARAMGVRALPITLPEMAVKMVGLLSEVAGHLARCPVFFNIQKAREACATSWSCSIKRAQEELGYRPAVSLAQGIVRTYRWYLGQGLLVS